MVAVNLVLLSAAAIASTDASSKVLGEEIAGFALAIASIAAVIATVLIGTLHLERKWYSARAVAESVKTLAWKYITCASPFGTGLSQSSVDHEFCRYLSSLLKTKVDFSFDDATEQSASHEITQKMREIRAGNLRLRKSLYLKERVEDQRSWYARKAALNRLCSRKWLAAIILVEILVVMVALVSIRTSQQSQSVGVLAAIAAAFIAWLQMKRHQELIQSYSVAAHELSLIMARGEHIDSEKEFALFVIDSENAMSREHTLWLAKRGSLS